MRFCEEGPTGSANEFARVGRFERDHSRRCRGIPFRLVIERVEVGVAVRENQEENALHAASEPDVGQMFEQ